MQLSEVKKYFIDHGCKLLKKKYINAHVKMKYLCSCNNISYINLNNFKNGKRCGCGRKGVRKYSDLKIKEIVESKNLTYISSEYLNNRHIITCLCKCGKERKCQLKSIKRSDGCSNCLRNKFSFSYDYVKKYFEKNGCVLIEKNYINARKKLKYVCVCGNISSIIFESFKVGNRCRECGNKKNSLWMKKNRLGKNNPRWIKDRNKKKIDDRFANRCRNMVKNVLKNFNLKKTEKTEKILGYKFFELKEHLESHPNWQKVKNKKWHIDHIFPLKAFIDYDIKDVRLANCLENLQPMEEIENISKSCKYNKDEFENWLVSKNSLTRKEGNYGL